MTFRQCWLSSYLILSPLLICKLSKTWFTKDTFFSKSLKLMKIVEIGVYSTFTKNVRFWEKLTKVNLNSYLLFQFIFFFWCVKCTSVVYKFYILFRSTLYLSTLFKFTGGKLERSNLSLTYFFSNSSWFVLCINLVCLISDYVRFVRSVNIGVEIVVTHLERS